MTELDHIGLLIQSRDLECFAATASRLGDLGFGFVAGGSAFQDSGAETSANPIHSGFESEYVVNLRMHTSNNWLHNVFVVFGKSPLIAAQNAHIADGSESSAISPRQAALASQHLERRNQMAELKLYVENKARRGFISEEIARTTLNFWQRLNSSTSGALSIPNAAPGDNGEMMLAWDAAQFHMELEIGPSEAPCFFFADRLGSMESWIAVADDSDHLPSVVFNHLSLFCRDAQ